MATIDSDEFDRIGLQNQLFVPAPMADIRDEPTLAALFSVDTNYGRWLQPAFTYYK